jgi:hypothetical protein
MMKTASQPTYLYVQRTYIVWFLYLLKNNKNTTPVFKFPLKKQLHFHGHRTVRMTHFPDRRGPRSVVSSSCHGDGVLVFTPPLQGSCSDDKNSCGS